MRVAVVLNAAAGGLLGRADMVELIGRHLEAFGLDAFVVPEGAPLPERMDMARDSGVDAVIVGGGDGSIACAAQALAGSGVALGILPLGTMNLLAKDLGVPLDLEQAVDALARGHMADIDVAEVNGEVFLCNSILGFAPHVAVQRERERGGGPLLWLRVLGATVKSLYRYPPLTVEVDLGTGPVRLRTKALAVADNAYDEGFGQVFTRSRLDRGELVLYLLRNVTPWTLLRLGAGMAVGRWRDHPNLETHRVAALTVTSRRKLLRVMNDGEVRLMAPPLVYGIRPRALKVIVPHPQGGAQEREEDTAA